MSGTRCKCDPTAGKQLQLESGCHSSSCQESSASLEVQGNSAPIRPISTGSLKNKSANKTSVKESQSDSTNENCLDTVHSGQNPIEKMHENNSNGETQRMKICHDRMRIAKLKVMFRKLPKLRIQMLPIGGHKSNAIDHVYPNGNINYIMKGDKINHIGWATCQYTHSKTKEYRMTYKCCLGVYNCPVPGCKFKSTPRLPRNPSKQSAKNPLSPKNLHCIIHDTTELIHIPCCLYQLKRR